MRISQFFFERSAIFNLSKPKSQTADPERNMAFLGRKSVEIPIDHF
jgi:hypothetical protein